MNISILCTQKGSIYETLDCETYDKSRDARTFNGSGPVICHPPCRSYSAFMSHWAKPEPGERAIAFYCLQKITKHGGVLEHPKHSKFVKYILRNPLWKVTEIHQSWFGYPTTKRTWLVTPARYIIPQPPFNLLTYGKERQIFENMSHNQRSKTTLQFAQYLINLVKINTGN